MTRIEIEFPLPQETVSQTPKPTVSYTTGESNSSDRYIIIILSFNLLEHHNLNLHQLTEAVFINTVVDIKTIVLYSSINNFQDHWQHILFIIYFALDVKVINQCDDGSRVRRLITPIYFVAVVKADLGSKLHRTTSLQREENKCGTRGQPR